jgi:drug/metabolite transporter (DMT)-like permease
VKQAERSGLLIALVGFACLSIGDGFVKSMATQWSPPAIGALRFAFGLLALSVLVLRKDGRKGLAVPLPRWQALRGCSVATGSACFFTALGFMPLGEATAITFTSPMFAALLAAMVLGEPMRLRTWLATLIAFAGVVIVLRPNLAAAGIAALLPMVTALATAGMIIGNRKAAGSASPLASQYHMALFAGPTLLLFAALGAWSGVPRFHVGWPDLSVVLRCMIVAVTASTGHYLLFLGTMRAGAALVAPMTYVQLLVAMGIGWGVFGEVPDLVALAGAAVIVAAGLVMIGGGNRQREMVSDLADRDG